MEWRSWEKNILKSTLPYHCNAITKKVHSYFHSLRNWDLLMLDQIFYKESPLPFPQLEKLRSFDVRPDILQMFFHSTVVSSLTYGCVCWGGKLSKQDKSRLEKIKKGGGILGRKQDSFDTLYEKRVAKKMNNILPDNTNLLKTEFNSQLNIHSCCYRALKVCTSRYENSFVPTSTSILKHFTSCFNLRGVLVS